MIKKHLKTLIIGSILILLPILAGVLLWDQLPAQIPMHWNAAGEVDGWGSKPLVVLGMPFIMLALNWLCVLATGADPKKANHSPKMMQLVLWIVPVLTVVLLTITYMSALGMTVQVEIVMPVFMGLLFTIIGNYLPKCKRNYTIGIKLPWTLDSEENWNKTHRFAGWIWTIGGILIMATGWLCGFVAFIIVLSAMALTPVIYSYILHKKGI